MKRAPFAPLRAPLVLFSAWFFFACSGSSTSCAGMTPIPGGTFQGPRSDDPLQARVSAKGFSTLNAQQQKILGLIAPGSTMNVPVSCTRQTVTLLGNLFIADQGSAGCLTESCGLMDGQCTSADVPVNIPVTFNSLQLQPSPPSSLAATVDVTFSTGKLYVDSEDRTHALCFFSGNTPLKCGVDFNTARVPPLSNTIVATIELTVDAAFSERIAVNLKAVDGLKACGTSGALPAPRCTDSNDLIITPEATGCCPGAQFGAVKDFLLGFLADELKKQLQKAVEDQTCEVCSASGGCPVEEDGGTPSSCLSSRNICWSTALNRCAPRRAGVEGRLDPSMLVSGTTTGAQVDLTLMMGNRAATNTGLDLGSRGGAKAVDAGECVPALPEPTFAASAPVNFDAQNDAGYELGLAVARGYLDRVGFQMHQSGGLCGAISTASFAQVNTGLLRPFLPSLGEVLGDQDAPMLLQLRPQQPPTFTVRAGTFDPTTKAMIEPLLVANLKDFAIEFHILLEDRYVKFFTATIDAAIPLSLIPDGCGRVLPVVGDLGNVVSNVRFSQSEILPDDLNAALGPLIPAVISFAEPALTQNLAAFNIPAFGPFKMNLIEAKGVTPAGNGTFDHAALFTLLVPADECIAPPPPELTASVTSIDTSAITRPTVTVDLGRAMWASYRLDDGLWSTFAYGSSLVVDRPALRWQGRHRIEVRVRENFEEASTVLEPMFATIDLQAPVVRLGRANGVVTARGYDSLTPREELRFSYRFANTEWVSRAPRDVSVEEVDARGGLTVRVTDGAGRSAEQTIRPLTVAQRAEEDAAISTPAGGCSMTSGAPVLLAALVAAAMWRRRRSVCGRG